MIEVEHLSKIYGSTPALKDVSFAVEPGEILGFLGPNGAGKTTTMRILSGYLPASGGTARVAGYEVHEQSLAVRERIGYLPETPPLYPEMTVEGFLYFVARIKRVAAGDRAARVKSAIERCGLVEKRSVLIRKLSKGFRQRVGIAQAIVHDPPVIILDEPTVGLDPRQILEVRNLIKGLAGQHTIILSTHILPEVSMTCSRVTIINKGQVVATGSPENLEAELATGSGYELEVEGEVEGETFGFLQTVPGVQSLEVISAANLPSNRRKLRVSCQTEMEPGREIVAALVASGFGLYEMQRTRATLEDVFLELTTSQKGIAAVESEAIADGQETASAIDANSQQEPLASSSDRSSTEAAVESDRQPEPPPTNPEP